MTTPARGRTPNQRGIASWARSSAASANASIASRDRKAYLESLRRRLSTGVTSRDPRSEEHTSELQSRLHLVCRLLLEKKKSKLLNWIVRCKKVTWRSADDLDYQEALPLVATCVTSGAGVASRTERDAGIARLPSAVYV